MIQKDVKDSTQDRDEKPSRREIPKPSAVGIMCVLWIFAVGGATFIIVTGGSVVQAVLFALLSPVGIILSGFAVYLIDMRVKKCRERKGKAGISLFLCWGNPER